LDDSETVFAARQPTPSCTLGHRARRELGHLPRHPRPTTEPRIFRQTRRRPTHTTVPGRRSRGKTTPVNVPGCSVETLSTLVLVAGMPPRRPATLGKRHSRGAVIERSRRATPGMPPHSSVTNARSIRRMLVWSSGFIVRRVASVLRCSPACRRSRTRDRYRCAVPPATREPGYPVNPDTLPHRQGSWPFSSPSASQPPAELPPSPSTPGDRCGEPAVGRGSPRGAARRSSHRCHRTKGPEAITRNDPPAHDICRMQRGKNGRTPRPAAIINGLSNPAAGSGPWSPNRRRTTATDRLGPTTRTAWRKTRNRP